MTTSSASPPTRRALRYVFAQCTTCLWHCQDWQNMARLAHWPGSLLPAIPHLITLPHLGMTVNHIACSGSSNMQQQEVAQPTG